MSWLYLVLAIVLEVSGTTSMKWSQGFTQTLPSVLMFLFYGLSLSALTLALKTIDVSVAYAVWSGLGTALIATVGVLWLKEPLNTLKIASLMLIIIGVIGLHLSGDEHWTPAPPSRHADTTGGPMKITMRRKVESPKRTEVPTTPSTSGNLSDSDS